MTEIINKFLALGTILSDIFLILIVLYFWLIKGDDKIKQFFKKNGLLLAWLIALASVLFSLYYSEIVGFEPCSLCWWSRVFTYPQAIILGMAYFKKEYKNSISYCLVLTILGTIISLYQNYLQYGGTGLFACSSTAVSCTKLYVFEFGFVTIPIMSLTVFLLLLFFLKVSKKQN